MSTIPNDDLDIVDFDSLASQFEDANMWGLFISFMGEGPRINVAVFDNFSMLSLLRSY